MHENPDQLANGPHDQADRTFSTEKTLMFTSTMVTLGTHNHLKKLRIDEQSYFQSARVLQNNSEYLGLLNHWLHKLEESGVKERMWKNWTYKASEDFSFKEPIQLGYGNLIFVSITIMGGLVLSALTFLCERMVDKATESRAQEQAAG